MKFPIDRGPNAPLANETATIVIENETPAMPMIDPAMVDSNACALSGWVLINKIKSNSTLSAKRRSSAKVVGTISREINRIRAAINQ